MASSAGRKAAMILFCSPTCAYGHQIRIVLNEKAIDSGVEFIDPAHPPEDLIDLNPYGSMPTLVDRDLVLYDARIIMEYLDERFPHPPLVPTDPVGRARSRMLVHRIERDWYPYLEPIEAGDGPGAAHGRNRLRESLIAASPVFGAKPYFLSEDYSLVDCVLAPLLWRLGALGVDLPSSCDTIRRYARRVFEREAFQASLSEHERGLVVFAEAWVV
ncbi:glutathione S-transferase N-terminal domain-containing protein [Methylotetracoccus oryzae]